MSHSPKQVLVAALLIVATLLQSQVESFSPTISTARPITHRSITSSSFSLSTPPISSSTKQQTYHPSSKSPLFHARHDKFQLASTTKSDDDGELTPLPTYGGLLGRLTGLSMTAIRKSVRTTTGLSITALRTTLRGLTGVSVNASLKTLFGVFPPWFRYFLQPFFIMYYTPLMICKYFIGSKKGAKEDALASHEKIVEGWKDAIKAAELAQDFWPLHVTEDGKIESLTPQSVPVNDIIVESLDIASTVQESKEDKKD